MNLIMNEQDYRPIFLITNHAAAAADVIRATEQIWAVLKSQEQRSETQPNQLSKLATKLCIYQTEPLSLATFFKSVIFHSVLIWERQTARGFQDSLLDIFTASIIHTSDNTADSPKGYRS